MLFKLFMVSVLMVLPSFLHANVDINQTVPDFTLVDTNGQLHQLSAYKGKYIVLEWFNYDCPFVVKHYSTNNMQQIQKEFTDKGVVWLSVNSSAEGKQGYYLPTEMNQKAQERQVASTAILLDSDGKVGRLYGAQTTPHMYIIDPQGVLIYQGAIDDNPSANPDDVLTARNYVKEALNAALAGNPIIDSSTKSYGCSVKY